MGSVCEFDFPAFDEFVKAVGMQAFREAVVKAVRAEVIESLLKDAWRRTPKQTGRLRESIYQRVVTVGDQELEIEIGYTAPYAPMVHEALDMPHTTGEAKFLEHALTAALPGFTARVAERVRRIKR